MPNSYATLAVTEMYGPVTTYRVLAMGVSLDEAKAAAAQCEPDWDASVQCHRLGHNQASATQGHVYRVIARNVEEYDRADYEVDGAVVIWDAGNRWLTALAAA